MGARTRPIERRFMGRFTFALTLACLVTGATLAQQERSPPEEKQDPAFTVANVSRDAFAQPAPALTQRQLQQFMVGRRIFNRQWAAVVSLNGDWGLGPTFNADRCSSCHANAGRGVLPARSEQQLSEALVRLSVPGSDPHGGPLPHPHYGGQLQNRSLDGSSVDLAVTGDPVPAEAATYVDWIEHTVKFDDGDAVVLRRPKLRIEALAFGPLGPDVMLSLRNAQPLLGLGLLDAVPEEHLLDLATRQRAVGFNGRPNRVWDAIHSRMAVGRYGWKASQATLREQIAKAAIEDMGLASRYFPEQNCPPVQLRCASQLPGNNPEFATVEIASVEFWLRGLAIPAQRATQAPENVLGLQLFIQAQCAVCHVPTLRTAANVPDLPQWANRMVPAYTDLLLHDMGEDLSDGRPEYAAGPRDWRTAPLWGIGLTPTVSGTIALLHDGRARSITEAILWHGGEAGESRARFLRMPKSDREALLQFLQSL